MRWNSKMPVSTWPYNTSLGELLFKIILCTIQIVTLKKMLSNLATIFLGNICRSLVAYISVLITDVVTYFTLVNM